MNQRFFSDYLSAQAVALRLGEEYGVYACYDYRGQDWFVGTHSQYIELEHSRCIVCGRQTAGDYCCESHRWLDSKYGHYKMEWVVSYNLPTLPPVPREFQILPSPLPV